MIFMYGVFAQAEPDSEPPPCSSLFVQCQGYAKTVVHTSVLAQVLSRSIDGA